jgi:folate-binding protein YgfZ
MKTVLTERMTVQHAALAEYSGAETAARFGDVNAEFAAITQSCGVYDLGWRAKIKVTGDDRVRWLNGMVTNNVRDLSPNRGNYNFILSPQGRILGDMYIYNRGDHLLIDTERAQLASLLKLLEHYIIMDDVELADITDALTSIGIQGPQTDKILRAVGISSATVDPLSIHEVAWNGVTVSVARIPNEDYPTYELWLSREAALQLWDALVRAGAKPVGFEALEKFRVLTGVPRYGQDIREKDLPQETGQQRALDFNKGCYVGQEIVERIHSRGNVHRTFTGFVLSGDVVRGAKVKAGEKEVGEVTSVARVPVNGNERVLAMGFIRREAGGVGAEVVVGDALARITKLPFRDL